MMAQTFINDISQPLNFCQVATDAVQSIMIKTCLYNNDVDKGYISIPPSEKMSIHL